MKTIPSPALSLAVTSCLALLCPASALLAQTATQDIPLDAGWNAVWLEVEPIYPDDHAHSPGQAKAPDDVFTNPTVTKVISPNPSAGTAEFFAQNPTAVPATITQALWQQWSRSAVANNNNLRMVTGNRPYLIHASAPGAVAITGKVRFQRPVWVADRYNLIGFGLAGTPASPTLPTFAEFFAPVSTTHQASRIYQLNATSGNWTAVTPTTAMTSNEAYWIFSNGSSDYMGPIAVDFKGAPTGGLSFGGPTDVRQVGTGTDGLELDLEEIVFSNLSESQPGAPTLDLIEADPGPGTLALHVVKPNSTNLGYTLGNRVDTAAGPTTNPSNLDEIVNGGTTRILTLGARRNWNSGQAGRTNLYRLQTGGKTLFWLPISATRTDVLLPTDLLPESNVGNVKGLWIGEVSVTGVSSLVENGAPVRPVTAPAPIRLLLHSDDSGKVRLLSQVTIMKSRSADPSVTPASVLVVDDERIPFFEGIKERNGKKVGIRLEAVAFEMPRDTSRSAQEDENQQDGVVDDLIDFIVAESTSPSSDWRDGTGLYNTRSDVTPAAIDSYLLFRNLRPPTLKEVYHSTLPCDGALGAGKTVQTRPSTLSMDGFHRANPFRHAFHQKHAKGPRITRELSIVLNPEQTVPDRLLGTYREEITGLTKSRITLTGDIRMQRVTKIGTLEGAQ